MSKFPLVSIIIVNWNGGQVFKNCLRSLSKIDYPNWELIVVDNGSTDGSQWLPQNFQFPISPGLAKRSGAGNFQLIENKSNLGFAGANNQGYKRTRGKYILLLNNDTKAEPDFLSKLVKRMEEDPSIGVIQPKIYLMDKPGFLDNAGSFLTKIGFLQHWGFGQKDGMEFFDEQEIFSAKGACMLIRREVIEKVGLFDDDFFSYFEESDFCWRVWMAGYRVVFYPPVTIQHKVGFTIRRLNVGEINFHYYKNRISSLIKNLETKNLIILMPHIFISAVLALIFLLKIKPRYAFLIMKALFWNILNLPKILEKRRQIQLERKVRDDELFGKLMRPFSWRAHFRDFKRVEEDLERKI